MAFAQQTASDPPSAAPSREQVVVVAPRTVMREALPSYRGEEVALTASVWYGDLDLRSEGDAQKLESRIATAANEVCTKLVSIYPQGSPPEPVCIHRATDKAMVDAHALIDDARGAHR